MDSRARPRPRRRAAKACIACRQSKIKCSGDEPCVTCQRRLIKCRFGPVKSPPVEQRSLPSPVEPPRPAADSQGIRLRAQRPVDASWFPIDQAPATDGADNRYRDQPAARRAVDDSSITWSSPFTLPSPTIVNTHKNNRRWIWLAPSSMWSFTARLTLMMAEKLNVESPYSAPNFRDPDIYSLHWDPVPATATPDTTDLPPLDHARYMFSTVRFHLGKIYRLVDEPAFLAAMDDFYHGNAVDVATRSRLWFVQFLLVLSFGRAFLPRSKNTTSPPGAEYFVRAMALMPDQASLWKNSLLAIDVLALTSLYLYSIDQRESGHVYIGQAIRISHFEGLHTQLPESQLGSEVLTRCRNLWWTLYIMDRHFSSSLGLPFATQDSEITTLLGSAGTDGQQDPILSLQVKLSRLLSYILNSVYKSENIQLGQFLESVRSVLHALAGYAQDIEKLIQHKFQNSVNVTPRGTQHITLLYHQCVIFTTRPLLLSVLKQLLVTLDQGGSEPQDLIGLTKTLISTGIKSSIKTIQLLSDEDSLLEVFLPFNLEFAYGAAMFLMMANAIFPDEQYPVSGAYEILDEMIHKGNRVAEVRKAGLVHLEELFKELTVRARRRGIQTLLLTTPADDSSTAMDTDAVVQAEDQTVHHHHHHHHQEGGETSMAASSSQQEAELGAILGNSMDPQTPSSAFPQTASDAELLDSMGISSYEFLSIVDLMDDQASDFFGALSAG